MSGNGYIGSGAPQSRAPLLCLFAGSLELASIGVGESRGASESEFYEIFIEQALVATVCVGVQVEVSEGAAVGVFNKAPLPRVIGRFSYSKANAPKPYSKSTERTSVDADGRGSPSSLGGDIDCDQVDGPIPTPLGDLDTRDGDGLACE